MDRAPEDINGIVTLDNWENLPKRLFLKEESGLREGKHEYWRTLELVTVESCYHQPWPWRGKGMGAVRIQKKVFWRGLSSVLQVPGRELREQKSWHHSPLTPLILLVVPLIGWTQSKVDGLNRSQRAGDPMIQSTQGSHPRRGADWRLKNGSGGTYSKYPAWRLNDFHFYY